MAREVVLPGWLGPTVFTPLDAGELASFRAALRGHAHARWCVIGVTCESDGTVYAAFCVDPAGETIAVVDVDAPYATRFVASTRARFDACCDVLVAAWPEIACGDDERADQLRDELSVIDPAAMTDEGAFWPTLLETLVAL